MISRPAIESDTDVLVHLLHEMHKEGQKQSVAFIADDVREFLKMYFTDALPRIKMFVACNRHGAVVGFLMCHMHQLFYNKLHKQATHELWYVTPTARGSNAAYKLFTSFGVWALEQGALTLRSGVATNNEKMRKSVGRMLEKLGFQADGTTYRKDFARVR